MLQCDCPLKSVCKPVSFSSWPAQNLDLDAFVQSTFFGVMAYISDGNTTPNHGNVSAMPHPLRPKANKGLSGIDTWHEKRCDFQLLWPHQSRYYH